MNHETDTIVGLFPSPVYITKRDSNLDSTEEKEIEDIIEEGMSAKTTNSNSSSKNSYIFDTRLYKLKEFCKEHIETYVEKIISPKKELDFYITQSWLNITKPGESHGLHSHPNSIISGVFYVSTEEDDKIYFHDPGGSKKNRIELATVVAETLAKKALEKKIIKVYFDRGLYKYHGRVKTFAETLRKNGLEF